MTLYEAICKIYPELKVEDFSPEGGTIRIQKDSGNNQEYIFSWSNTVFQQPTEQELKDANYGNHQ